jgi:hypothetical protein
MRPTDHELQEAGIDGPSLKDFRDGVSPSLRLSKALVRMGRKDLSAIAKKLKEETVHISDARAALEKRAGLEPILKRIDAGEFT